MRAMLSVGPPAAIGTIMWTDRSGQARGCVCASAARPPSPGANAVAAESAIRRRRVSISRPLQNEPAQICVLGEVADVLLHVAGIDLDRLAGTVGSAKGHVVEDPLHHCLQAAGADIFHAGIDC